MTDEMGRDIPSEVKGIMDQYSDSKYTCSVLILKYTIRKYSAEHNMEEFMEYEIAGGGGTDFEVCWNYFKEEGIVPKKFVMFTDGYLGTVGETNPTVILCLLYTVVVMVVKFLKHLPV